MNEQEFKKLRLQNQKSSIETNEIIKSYDKKVDNIIPETIESKQNDNENYYDRTNNYTDEEKPLIEDIKHKDNINNRVFQISRNNDNFKMYTVSLTDIDNAILYQFENKINPKVNDNGNSISVPIFYANQERWVSIQKYGHLKDAKNKILLPVITYKRTNVEKNTTYPLDKLDNKIVYHYKNKWDKSTRYDSGNSNAINEQYTIAIPDFVKVTYDCIIWTEYIEQMNILIADIFRHKNMYWGDDNKFSFITLINNFNIESEVNTEQDRMVKSTFQLTTNAYLLPDHLASQMTVTKLLPVKSIDIKENIYTQTEVLVPFKS